MMMKIGDEQIKAIFQQLQPQEKILIFVTKKNQKSKHD